jgi:hypothetical protein
MSRYWMAWFLIAAIPLALLAPLLLLLVTDEPAWIIVSMFLIGGALGAALNEIRCPSCGLRVVARPVRIGKGYLELNCFPSRRCRECGSSL